MDCKRNRPAGRAGFTLVEMLIVLGILVLLLSMVVPRFLGSAKKAKIDAAKTQIGMFRAALEHYAVDCNDFPTTEQGLEALGTQPADLPENVTWGGPYITGTIGVDPWGNAYQYEYPPTHGTQDLPDIWSYGPDGEEGTDDDITNWGGGTGGEGEPGMELEPRVKPEGGPPRERRKPSSKPVVPKAIRSDSPEKPKF
jgi:general secretion pathway protein G